MEIILISFENTLTLILIIMLPLTVLGATEEAEAFNNSVLNTINTLSLEYLYRYILFLNF